MVYCPCCSAVKRNAKDAGDKQSLKKTLVLLDFICPSLTQIHKAYVKDNQHAPKLNLKKLHSAIILPVCLNNIKGI